MEIDMFGKPRIRGRLKWAVRKCLRVRASLGYQKMMVTGSGQDGVIVTKTIPISGLSDEKAAVEIANLFWETTVVEGVVLILVVARQ